MFRKTSGAILCPSCGRLTNADAPVCLVCGRRNPGMWGFGGALGTLFRRWSFVTAVTVVCIALYVASLVLDPTAAFRSRGMLGVFSPSGEALWILGAAGATAWQAGHWWTVLTAMYLHGGLLHILFNLLWIRQLAPAVEDLYGPARLTVIFTVAGALGFAVSDFFGVPLTIGASGSIFGLLGAIVAYGRRRGGTYGSLIFRQYGMWAAILFVYGLLPGTGVDNFAHAGGFVGGLLCGLALSVAEHRREQGFERVLAALCIVITVLAFVLQIGSAFF